MQNNNASRRNDTTETLRFYMKEISYIPLLTAEEERELGRRIQQGDDAAMQKLVESNLRFVIKCARRYREFGVPFQDLINEGNLGLITAAKRFDPSRNVRFISYAVWWIRQSILTALANLGRPFKVPLKINTALYKVRVSASTSLKELSHKPTLEETARDVGMTQGELLRVMGAGAEGISLNNPISAEGEAGIEDVLYQNRIPSAEQGVVEGSVKKTLKGVLEGLKDREREILSLRYGLNDDTSLTLKQIGDRMGVSRERVRQIQEEALEKIRTNHNKTLSFRREVALLEKISASKESSLA